MTSDLILYECVVNFQIFFYFLIIIVSANSMLMTIADKLKFITVSSSSISRKVRFEINTHLNDSSINRQRRDIAAIRVTQILMTVTNIMKYL